MKRFNTCEIKKEPEKKTNYLEKSIPKRKEEKKTEETSAIPIQGMYRNIF